MLPVSALSSPCCCTQHPPSACHRARPTHLLATAVDEFALRPTASLAMHSNHCVCTTLYTHPTTPACNPPTYLLAGAVDEFVLRPSWSLDDALNRDPVTVQGVLVSILSCVPQRHLHKAQQRKSGKARQLRITQCQCVSGQKFAEGSSHASGPPSSLSGASASTSHCVPAGSNSRPKLRIASKLEQTATFHNSSSFSP